MKANGLGIELLAEQGGRCALCRLELQPNAVTIDHIVPLALGGTSVRTNLQAAHRKCNTWKGSIENSIGHCWRCFAQVSGEIGALKHWDKRHPHGFVTAKAWRKAAKAGLKRAQPKAKGPARTPRIVKPPRPHRPLPPDGRVPRNPNVPYQATKLEPVPIAAGSNGIIADGAVGSP